QVRPAHGPAERPPFLCQLLPAVPARGGHEPAGADTAAGGLARTAPAARAVAARGSGGPTEAATLQAEATARRAGRRTASDVAAVADQGGGDCAQQRQACADPAVGRLATPGAIQASLAEAGRGVGPSASPSIKDGNTV